jgi:hypothetical protein
VVVGLYPTTDKSGKKVLSPVSRAQCIEVATHSSMVLQGYIWDDIILDPTRQADWVVDMLAMEGLPVKWLWGDQEQWWTDWDKYNLAKFGKLPWIAVPRATSMNINSHMQIFMQRLAYRFPKSGVYTNNGFVSSWAPAMNAWLPLYNSWVAQYKFQPKEQTKMTWAQLKERWLPDFDISLAPGQLPEKVVGLQFTGDTCQLPGSYNQYAGKIPFYDGRLPLDVSAFRKVFIDGLCLAMPQAQNPAPVPDPAASYKIGDFNSKVIKPVWVLAGPGNQYKATSMLMVGDKVMVVMAMNGYSKIETGWVASSCLAPV